MSKLSISQKLGTTNKKSTSKHRKSQFLSLDVNCKSYSPQNIQENPYDIDLELRNYSPKFNYESRKFKVRSPANFIKTVQNWNNMPYQRIKKVQRIIQMSKDKQTLIMSQRGGNLPQFCHFSVSTSPKTRSKRQTLQEKLKKIHDSQRKRMKQIQQTFIKNKQENQQQNIIRFENKKGNYFQSKQLDDFEIGSNNFDKNRVMNRLKEKKKMRNIEDQSAESKNKTTLYAYMVKNRRKLSQRRHNKKKSVDYSLLGRINYLQQFQNSQSFFLRNSLQNA